MNDPWGDAFAYGDAQLAAASSSAAAARDIRRSTDRILRLKEQIKQYESAYGQMLESRDSVLDQRDAWREAIQLLSPEQRTMLVRAASEAYERNRREREQAGQHGSIQSRNERLADVRF